MAHKQTVLLAAIMIFSSLFKAPSAEPAISDLAAANNTFAFNWFKELYQGQPADNLFVSPYSAATALQMTATGAAGKTRQEMQQALGTAGMTGANIVAASKAAAALFNSTDTNLILTTANALWYRPSSKVKPGFLEASQDAFAASIKPLDFSDAQSAVAAINQWASDQTHGRIDKIVDRGIDPRSTDMLLANAIYFKGMWLDPFNKRLTHDRPFHPATGAAKPAPMMDKSKKFAYRESSGYQAVRLPYVGGYLGMYVFLPAPDSSPAKLLKSLNGESWRRDITTGFSEREGHLALPKFKLENSLELNASLKALGMKTAFDPGHADFSTMFEDQHYISEVRQKAFVEVSEEGTEAAAVTTVAVGRAMVRPPENRFEMICDRPFLFAIVDARSEMILFMGVVNKL